MTGNDYPPDYERFLIEAVEHAPDAIKIRYGGRMFGGILRESLAGTDHERAIRPGAELLVRYHDAKPGERGQVAHMLVRRAATNDWAEIYVDTDVC